MPTAEMTPRDFILTYLRPLAVAFDDAASLPPPANAGATAAIDGQSEWTAWSARRRRR